MPRKVSIPGQDVPIQLGSAINPDWYTVLKFLETLQPLSDADIPSILASLLLKSDILRTINDVSTPSYTFALSDSGKYCRFANASAITATVPPHSSIAFEAGTQIDLAQSGVGKLTLAQGSGVTINSFNGNKSLAGRYAGAMLIQTSTVDTWDLIGSLVP